MSTGMGDGDLVDPAVHGLDDADTAPPPPDEGGAEFAGDDEAPERASEIDDITESIPRPDAEELDVDVVALVAERDEYKAIAQRIQADFDNFRRQSAQRSQDEADRATGRLAQALLPVLDAAESAYLTHPDEVGPLLNTMLTELKKHGLETLDLDGQPFDPEVAEAVAHEPGGDGEPVVAEVLRSGYRWKGRTLRAAMVRTRG
jgi:molecular chaperone GrpE